MIKILIIISSRFPNYDLENTIEKIYKHQNFKKYHIDICIIDSDSSTFYTYKNLKNKYQNIFIEMSRNCNYEYGAYKKGHELYPDYDVYFCVQDTVYITKEIDFSVFIDSTKVGILYDKDLSNLGFLNHYNLDKVASNILGKVNINQEYYYKKNFTMCIHNTFIASKKIINDMFINLINGPKDKNETCAYERIFSLYFIYNKFNLEYFYISEDAVKINGKRSYTW